LKNEEARARKKFHPACRFRLWRPWYLLGALEGESVGDE